MIKRGFRKCILCDAEYKYCTRCPADGDKPKWMVDFHSENCKKIFDAASNYVNKRLSAKEAKEILLGCTLELEKYSDNTRRLIEEILAYKEEVVAEHVAEAEVKEEPIVEKVEEIAVAKEPAVEVKTSVKKNDYQQKRDARKNAYRR